MTPDRHRRADRPETALRVEADALLAEIAASGLDA